MGRVYNPRQEEWKRIERRGAKAAFSHVLLAADPSPSVRLGLTRIQAGSTLGMHVDDYAHAFFVSGGHGEVQLGRTRQSIGPGDVILTEVGEVHGLWADAADDLVLVVANAYPPQP